LGELQQAFGQLQAERNTLLASRTQADESAATLAGRIADLTTQTSQLQARLSDAVETRAPEKQRLDELLQEMKRLHTELGTAQEQARRADEAAKTVETLRAQLAQAEIGLAQKTAELNAAQSRTTELGQEMTSLAQVRQALEQRLSASGQEHTQRTDESVKIIEGLRTQLTQTETSMAQKTAELNAAQGRIKELGEHVSRIEQARQEAEQRLGTSEAAARQVREALVAAETGKSTTAQQAANLSTQLQDLQAKLTERTREVGDLSARVALIPDLEQRLTASTEERDKLRQDVAKLTEEYTLARARGENVNAELVRLRGSLEQHQRELGGAQRAASEAEQRANQLTGQVDAMQQELARASAEREHMRAQLADVSGQRGALQTQLGAMTRLKEEADGRIVKLSNDLTALQTDLAQTVSARDTAQNQAKALTEKLSAAQREIENLTLARTEIESRASHLRQQLSSTTDQVLDLSGAVSRLRDQVRGQDLSQLAVLPKTLAKGVTFEHRRTTLSEESKKLLAEASAILQRYPDVKMVIEGYTDSVGSADFNRLLSQHRANAVRDYLLEQGIQEERLVAVGFGAENPVASNATPAGRALNRRIEFRLSQTPEAEGAGTALPDGKASEKPVQLEFQQPPERR
jgi:outer membrane protein OmpA-like peptidoglycan-associated protein